MPAVHKPRWYMIPVRAVLAAFLMTLISFAVVLLFSMASLLIAAKLHGTAPDLRLAYRQIALPVAVAVGTTVLILSLIMEVRHYRQSKVLADIARTSR